MTVLYKYYSANLELDKYLLSPTIRLSQTSGLNDPFEGLITLTMIKEITKIMLSNETFESSGSQRYDYVHMRRVINQVMQSFGVVSLTETHRNLLMWAHYASEHTGCCIGYESNMLSTKKNKIHEKEVCYSYTPQKINYDSVIFDDELMSGLKNANKFEDSTLHNIIKRTITTKSNDWIYEKEHRMVIPVEWSDEIVIRSIDRLPAHIKHVLKHMGPENGYEVSIEKQTATIKHSISTKRKLWDEEIGISYENRLSPYKKTMFLKKIGKNKICSIYLGALYPHEKQQTLINILSDKRNKLEHIKLYKYQVSSERFELTATNIPLFDHSER
ncbi:DUF2971 domain-containing protein [Aeromonas allosaccharophila]|uniref:DUF2971 domain-containing protein n=1 Tax=Aeromonas allosaccharophila TaxID=656 RepID=UPI00111A1655|nr:DUF2971 domain-containing protein [Aeromonas allosaccharophila]